MKHLHISPAWFFTDGQGEQLDPRLFALLRAIHKQNKLTQAAEACGFSYRHAWNMLQHWEEFFGTPLIEKQRGRGSRLSPLGEKLLWAEQRVAARLEPQLKSLSSEINLEIAHLLEGNKPILRLHASHGYAVALLPKYMGELPLDLQYCSPVDALSALARNACDIAGFHLPIDTAPALYREYRKRLKPRNHRIIQFITRRQGLMLQAGNPLGVKGLADLTKIDLRFINRQANSGTRSLLDALLNEQGMANASIKGFEQEEFTHSAVAAYIAANMADVGFGVEAAARQFGLDFIPLARERYVMACHAQALNEPKFRQFLDIIASEQFQAAVAQLPGYDARGCGVVSSVNEALKPPTK
jgi:molybdate transport repressor ModE-like protein